MNRDERRKHAKVVRSSLRQKGSPHLARDRQTVAEIVMQDEYSHDFLTRLVNALRDDAYEGYRTEICEFCRHLSIPECQALEDSAGGLDGFLHYLLDAKKFEQFETQEAQVSVC